MDQKFDFRSRRLRMEDLRHTAKTRGWRMALWSEMQRYDADPYILDWLEAMVEEEDRQRAKREAKERRREAQYQARLAEVRVPDGWVIAGREPHDEAELSPAIRAGIVIWLLMALCTVTGYICWIGGVL